MKSLSWPVGALIAQACHASTAVMHLFYDHEDTQTYLRELDRMHKIVLEVKDENELKKIDDKLTKGTIDHKLWIEQPENFPTCLAVRPYVKNEEDMKSLHVKLTEAEIDHKLWIEQPENF